MKNEKSKKKLPHRSENPLKQLVTKVPEHSELHTFSFNPYSPRHNMYYVSEITRAYKEERSLAREHVRSSMNLLKMFANSTNKIPSNEEVAERAVYL